MNKGRKALLVVVLTAARVLTPLILGGVLLGFYVGDEAGYSKSILAIAFSTAGFVIGMLVVFQMIRVVVARTDAPSR